MLQTMLSTKKILAATALAFSIAVGVDAQTKAQTIFNLEEDVRKEAPIPDDVIAVLKSDRKVDRCFREKGEGADEHRWFAASEIDLNGDRRMDLIIKSKDACLFGANQAPFWIFQKASDGYQKVLIAYGLQLTVLPKKIGSFNQIKISKNIAMKPSNEILTFRRGKYRVNRRGV